MASSPSSAPHPVDQVPPFGKLTILGIQHVLAFYAGAVVVPLVIASGLGLDNHTLVHLINADLLTCGIATIIQSAGIGRFIGVKLPLIQGVTFTAVSPLIAIGAAATPPGADPETGLATMYGSIIAVGLIVFLVAPFFAKLLRFFPPIVTGTLLTVMGTTLLSVSAGDIVAWADQATGDAAKATATFEALGFAFGTIAIIVIIQRLFKGFIGTLSVLLALVIMTGVAFVMGKTDFSGVGEASWLGITTPFYFGIPKFSATALLAMIIVMAVTAVETTGDVFATGEVVGKRIAPRDIANALRADGLSTLLGGVLNSFPYTCFAQNVGLVRLTRVKSRWVVTAAGVFMIILGLLPKAAAIVAAIPSPVIGGASLAMFANVAVVGIQTLAKVDLRDNRNAVIVSTSIGLALLVTLKPGIVSVMPSWLQIIFGSSTSCSSTSDARPRRTWPWWTARRSTWTTSTQWIATSSSRPSPRCSRRTRGRSSAPGNLVPSPPCLSCDPPSRTRSWRPTPRRPRSSSRPTRTSSPWSSTVRATSRPARIPRPCPWARCPPKKPRSCAPWLPPTARSLAARWSSAWTTWWTASICCPRAGVASNTPPPARLASHSARSSTSPTCASISWSQTRTPCAPRGTLALSASE